MFEFNFPSEYENTNVKNMTITTDYNKIKKFDNVVLRTNNIPSKFIIQDSYTFCYCLNISSFKTYIIKITTGIHIQIGESKIDKHYNQLLDVWKELSNDVDNNNNNNNNNRRNKYK